MKLFTVYEYIKHCLLARHKNGHGIHSPYIFDLITNHFSAGLPFYCFEEIEKQREILINNEKYIHVNDLGAGTSGKKPQNRKISTIAKKSAIDKKHGEILFRLVNFHNPNSILELGTSLGIGTSYLASYNSKVLVTSMEGCENIAKAARSTFNMLGLANINLIEGNFDDVLPVFLSRTNEIDFVYFDGNHRKEPTLRYFEACLKKRSENAVFVFDDIHWSIEMSKAWKIIKSHPEVTYSIDIFRMGIVFFRKDLGKKKIRLRL